MTAPSRTHFHRPASWGARKRISKGSVNWLSGATCQLERFRIKLPGALSNSIFSQPMQRATRHFRVLAIWSILATQQQFFLLRISRVKMSTSISSFVRAEIHHEKTNPRETILSYSGQIEKSKATSHQHVEAYQLDDAACFSFKIVLAAYRHVLHSSNRLYQAPRNSQLGWLRWPRNNRNSLAEDHCGQMSLAYAVDLIQELERAMLSHFEQLNAPYISVRFQMT